MRIRFYKILSDGRTVRFEKAAEKEPVIQLNLIVQRPPRAKEDRSP